MKAKNKILIVTGGGSGMGRELTLNLLLKGAKVVAIDINKSTLDETSALAGNHEKNLITYVVDITSRTAVEDFRNQVIAQQGAVDGLINNAGIIQPFVKVNALSYESIERVMQVNFYGTLYMTKAFLPHLLTRPKAHIVNISSMGGFLPVPGQTIYGASKAAVKLFTEGLHSELSNTNVKVTTVFPGAVATNITKNSGLQMPENTSQTNQAMKTLSASKAAEMIVAGMEKDAYRVLVGRDSKFMDFIYRVHPQRAAAFINKKMQALLASV